MTTIHRRTILGAFASGAGALALRSLATGIPASVLLDPLSARAETPKAKALILCTSSLGDPLNANVPGMYEVGANQIFHSQDALMTPTDFQLGDKTVRAARPWAELPDHILARTAFFHHATYTPVHGELGRVHRMMDGTEKNDMLVSLLARELAPSLNSVQSDPVSLGASGGELLSAEGRILANVAPLSVQRALGGPEGALAELTTLRDKHVDELYAIYKTNGTPTQRKLLDAWTRSRDEVRDIELSLVERLSEIDGNDQLNQIRCAAVLAAMNIAPVITIHMGFGGDNHNDTDFERETEETVAALSDLETLMDSLDSLQAEMNLDHDVLVATLNTFGRTLKKKGYGGRDHHEGHHVMLLMGNGIKPGVVGGVELDPAGKEYQSTSIDSATGDMHGDIPFEETLAAAGKTLAYALGVPEARVDDMIDGGKIVKSIVA